MALSARLRALAGIGFACLFLGCCSAAQAEKRIALVIANSSYEKTTKLINPRNDGIAIAAMLQKAGFDKVLMHENVNFQDLRKAVRDFSDASRDADMAVLYYSGHGIEVSGVNYLIPTDAALERDLDIPYEAYALDHLVQALEPVRKLRLIILDACRDNPFARSMKRTIGSRSVSSGLAPVEPTTSNTLIAFAAKAGSVALDGDGKNSPYTAALLKVLPTPGLDLRIAFGRVRDEVIRSTQSKQEPFLYGSLGGMELALVQEHKREDVAMMPAPQPGRSVDYQKEIELTYWNSVRESRSKDLLNAYLQRFPDGEFSQLARMLLQQLENSPPRSLDQGRPPLPTRLETPKQTVTSSPAVRAADNPSLVRDVQVELKRLGCLRAEPDGVWGSQSRAALDDLFKTKTKSIEAKEASEQLLSALKERTGVACVASVSPPKVQAPDPRPKPEAKPKPEKATGNSDCAKGWKWFGATCTRNGVNCTWRPPGQWNCY